MQSHDAVVALWPGVSVGSWREAVVLFCQGWQELQYNLDDVHFTVLLTESCLTTASCTGNGVEEHKCIQAPRPPPLFMSFILPLCHSIDSEKPVM